MAPLLLSDFELCQRIHWTALNNALRGRQQESLPVNLDMTQLAAIRRYWGAEALFFHPDHITRVFEGVNLTHYQTIEKLYCSRIGRSIAMTHNILMKMADVVSTAPISYEAVWAICRYLDEIHQKVTAVETAPTNCNWHLISLTPRVFVGSSSDKVSPEVICIVEWETSKVVAFRVSMGDIEGSIRLVIYDALVSTRKPEPLVAAGLVWHTPNRLLTELGLGENLKSLLEARFGIEVQHQSSQHPLVETLKGSWDKDLSGSQMSFKQFNRIFDNYLHRIHQHGPRRMENQLLYRYRSLTGYTSDPAAIFPALRGLLPEYETVITADGQVVVEGLHFEDPLLKYWSGRKITFCRSEHSGWVFIDGEILGEVKAQELRRADGSYRQWLYRREIDTGESR